MQQCIIDNILKAVSSSKPEIRRNRLEFYPILNCFFKLLENTPVPITHN